MKEHHWSGWPGAYCMDCGLEDPWEIAIGEGWYDPYTKGWMTEEEVSNHWDEMVRIRPEMTDRVDKETILEEFHYYKKICESPKGCHVEYNDKCPHCNPKIALNGLTS